uniref:AIR synthase related protein n=1 Tax=Siminovitchia fortis TaxID=254758 RepID=UPI0021B48880
MVGFMMDKQDRMGMDCVGMWVNDVVVEGGEGVYFLEYMGWGKGVGDKMEEIVKGMVDGWETAGCVVIGGERGEMGGM